MKTLYSMISVIMLIVLLVACGEVAPANNSIPTSLQISETSSQKIENIPTSTFTARSSFTPMPSNTPDLTGTVVSQYLISTRSAEQALIAQYPDICVKDVMAPPEFSPNGLWMIEECLGENDQGPILTFSNKESQALWKLSLHDYIYTENPGSLWYAGFVVAYWSNDGKYVYFAPLPVIDGGECYLRRNSHNIGDGLFRLDLENGRVTTVLPLQDNHRSYDFSFSSTGRQLIYQSGMSDLIILDINSGTSIHIKPTNKNQFGGGYLWSTDGLKFIYSTVSYGDNGPIDYSLRLVDSQSGSERILLESPKDCFVASEWINNRITVERYDEQYNQTLIDFDLNSNQIISEATATAHP